MIPQGIETTAWPRVVEQCARMGVTFDTWQHGIGQIALGKRADGKYAATVGGVVLSIPRQVGKALPVDTPILTPSGFRTMADLDLGDQVFAPSGDAVTVIVKSPVMHDHVVYQVTFTDGRTLKADAEHLWTVRDVRTGKWVTVTTQDMVNGGLDRGAGTRHVTLDGREYATREFRWQLPRQYAVQLPERDLLIDPYLLGAWLGDGVGVAARMVCSAEDAAHWAQTIVECGFIPSVRETRTCHEIGITCAEGPGRQSRSFGSKLRALGVLGDKHVPEEYLTASPWQREALLQGLMDTDGTIAQNGKAEFTAVNRNLADGVLFLARSLGWKTAIHEGRATLNGRDCGPKWRVTWTPDTEDGFSPFRMERKASRVKALTRVGTRTVSVAAIERVESVPVQCIGVDSEDHLYLAGRDLIPTHNTFLVGMIVIALCILQPGLTVLWTAHRTRTSSKTFKSMQGYVKRRRIAPHLKVNRSNGIRGTNGEQEIEFANGSIIMFGAREGGFGRGFDKVDIEVFDESQILGEKALEDMIAATNQSEQPEGALLFYMGTPPRPADPGEEFSSRRTGALSGQEHDIAYVEFSADDDADPDDESEWAKANPSYPVRTPLESMQRMRKHLRSDDSFRREALGIWATSSPRVIDEESWTRAADSASMPTERLALAVDVAPNRSTAAVALAGRRPDGLWHVELDEHRVGVDWVVPWIVERASRNALHAVVVDEMSGLVKWRNGRAFLGDTNVKVTQAAAEGRDMAIACAQFFDAVMAPAPNLRHTDQPQVNAALSVARKRPLGGGWAWNRKDEQSDITPVVAATLALWGARNETVKRPGGRRTQRMVVGL